MIHVCHLAKYYPPATGGIETHVRTLARAQHALGARVTVLCVNHQDPGGRDALQSSRVATPAVEESDGGIRILRAPRSFSLSKFDYSPGLSQKIRELARTGVDLFHMHAPNPTMSVALLKSGSALPLVITHHSDVVKQRILGAAYSFVEQRLLRRARLILTDSPPYAGGSNALSCHLAKVQALPLGIELPQFLDPPAEAIEHASRLRAEFPGPLWLCVGRLVYYKGFEDAIAAMTQLPGRLLVIGDGPLKDELQLTATSKNVADRIVWMGKTSNNELIGAYHAATALLFPSNARSEAFGLVQVEAMASGCPVINTAIPHSGVAWVSPDQISGITVPVGDWQALAAAARTLHERPEYRNRLAVAGRERAVAMFSADAMARRSMSSYAKVLDTADEVESSLSPPELTPRL